MNQKFPEFIKEIDSIRREIRKIKAPQLKSISIKERIRKLVETYFSIIRPTIVSAIDETEQTKVVDSIFQKLLEYSHKNGAISTYESFLAALRRNIIAIDTIAIIYHSKSVIKYTTDVIDKRIIVTLSDLVPNAALSFQQALTDLNQSDRYSWRGPGTDLREALRETLDTLAPDNEVVLMPGYKQEPNTNGPTMKQKAIFILKNREVNKTIIETTDRAINLIEEAMGSFVRSVYTRSSVSTHVITSKEEILRLKEMVKIVLCDLLEIRMDN